jgi:hypothetical protein
VSAIRRGEIGGNRIGASTRCADLINHCFGFVGVSTKVHDNVRASGGEG